MQEVKRTRSKAPETRRIREDVKHVTLRNLIIRTQGIAKYTFTMYVAFSKYLNSSLNDTGIIKLIRPQKVILQFVFPQ